MKIPTDLNILKRIYSDYIDEFEKFENDNSIRGSKIYVPIDILKLSTELGVDKDIIFGRLYYHLNNRFSYKNDDNSKVEFFANSVGGSKHCIHFPYMCSVLVELKTDRNRYLTSRNISIISLVISTIAFITSILY